MNSIYSKAPSSSPLLTIGLIADVQHANIPDGYNFSKTKKRYYRNSLVLLQEAVDKWNACKVHCAIQLGDLIDGFSKRGPDGNQGALQSALDILSKVNGPVYHMWGNHELYNFPRKHLFTSKLYSAKSENCAGVDGKAYYTILPHPQLKIIVLDCYEISLLGTEENSPEQLNSIEILKKNPNEDKNNPEGLMGNDARFVKFNGAVSPGQLQWLEDSLSCAAEKKQNVLIMGHLPLYRPSTSPMCLCWNYDEVLEILDRYADCVLCYFAGHDHDGGDAKDPSGILHITMPGVIEIPPDDNAYSVVRMYQNSLDIEGFGRAESFTLNLKYKIEEL